MRHPVVGCGQEEREREREIVWYRIVSWSTRFAPYFRFARDGRKLTALWPRCMNSEENCKIMPCLVCTFVLQISSINKFRRSLRVPPPTHTTIHLSWQVHDEAERDRKRGDDNSNSKGRAQLIQEPTLQIHLPEDERLSADVISDVVAPSGSAGAAGAVGTRDVLGDRRHSDIDVVNGTDSEVSETKEQLRRHHGSCAESRALASEEVGVVLSSAVMIVLLPCVINAIIAWSRVSKPSTYYSPCSSSSILIEVVSKFDQTFRRGVLQCTPGCGGDKVYRARKSGRMAEVRKRATEILGAVVWDSTGRY